MSKNMFSQAIVKRFAGIPTPFYYYDLAVLDETLSLASKAAAKYNYAVHYALKANAGPKLLAHIKSFGFGADCVSGNEVSRAAECGFQPKSIVFAGVGKTDAEIETGLLTGIHSFNCESLPELEVINQIAGKLGLRAPVALRLNPNVSANTHKYITTGLEENKFGINPWELDKVLGALQRLPHVQLVGLHFHIGSQITDLSAFKSLCLKVNEIQEWFRQRKIDVLNLNLGGGLGVDYHHPDQSLFPDFESYFRLFADFLNVYPGQQVHFELGRSLVAQCGTLISRVLYIKEGVNTNFMILDAGMTELLRPALYQSYHKIENLSEPANVPTRYDVVGPICESSDCFGKSLQVPLSKRGDLIAIRTAGAYGETMSSNYNLRNKALAYYSSEKK